MTQQLPLIEQLKALEHLQELDLKIDNLNKTKNSLPAALKALDDSLAKVRFSITTKKNALVEIDKVKGQTRAALDLNRDRLTRSSGRLEGVKNSQEFQAANKEIEQLKKLSGSLEEQSKKSELDTGVVHKDLEALTAQMEKLQGEREAQAGILAGQNSQLEGDISALAAERRQHSAKVDPRVLAQYDRVRGARGGIGFVPAVAGRCKGCNMMVPPQLFNEIRRAHVIHSCPSCHRILFVPVESGAQDGPVASSG